MKKTFIEWLRGDVKDSQRFNEQRDLKNQREHKAGEPQQAPLDMSKQNGADMKPMHPNDKNWLCVPDPYGSPRWSHDEGHSYKGEIYRVISCCKTHALIEMHEKHPDIKVVAIVLETLQELEDLPVMYNIVEA